ncbi:phosphatidylinositol-glycan biosynthesis class W protein [Aplysia californica]|uniref:Phosphatidylinositol-glycan biosynthesis class W protein n=1 Tax=Aplysia californica TaxID=6500 RepID=A0ABM0K746_APLCA|nr:phosphatidylinositol-glycan biosynthesis class W protein [Aplysia californica]
MASYKQEHEKFVTGYNGTTFSEVTFVTGISCISCFVREAGVLLLFRLFQEGSRTSNFLWRFFLDFMVLVLPNILSVTLMSDYIMELFLGIIASCVMLYFVYMKTVASKSHLILRSEVNLSDKKTFVTNFRSIINICAAVGILAVDFPIFPRRFVKAETYGFGLMDTGVGFYVVSNAIVSPEARGKLPNLSLVVSLKKAVVSSVPLLVIGCARLATVKGIEYQEHVSEYGVHWNFFFTLAALKVMCTAVTCLVPANQSGPMGVLVLVLYQVVLSNFGGSNYLLTGSDGKGGRTGGFFDANREGIFTLPGYVAIYLFGVHLGCFIFKQRKSLREWLSAAVKIAVSALVFALFLMVCHLGVQPVSRRFANVTYVCWMMCASILMLLECLLADIAVTFMKSVMHRPFEDSQSQQFVKVKKENSPDNRPVTRSRAKEMSSSGNSLEKIGATLDKNGREEKLAKSSQPSFCLLEAVTYNSLLFFLLANVMTGIVNLSVPTLNTGSHVAVAIVIAYMGVLCLVISVLRVKNISTKFW